MGDFNYRVNKTMEEVEKIIKKKEELKLLEFDQMNYEIKNYNLKCSGFKEGKIEFLPTYKYSDDQTNIIICDSIDHIPSWTDRILFMINENKFNFIDAEENDNKDIRESNNIQIEEKEEEEEINKEKDNKEKIKSYFQLISYNSMQDIVFSDHKPVFAYFNITINQLKTILK
jgi:hypothetical protein